MAVKKGFLLTIDALLASALFITAFILLFSVQVVVDDTFYTQRASQDIIASLNAISADEYVAHYPALQEILDNTTLLGSDSVLYALSLLYVTADPRLDGLAQSLQDHIPDDLWILLEMRTSQGTSVLYEQTVPVFERARSVARQQITGIDEGQPVAGSSSTAYLTRLRDKQTRSFTYFGGFVGQGEITTQLALPADVDGRMIELVAEIDIVQTARVYVNTNFCGEYTPSQPVTIPDTFDLVDCIPYLSAGVNSILLSFDDLTNASVQGGFIRATYTTDTFTTNPDLTTTTYRFPGIAGVVNLYDAFIVPAPIEEIEVFLHYNNPDPTVRAYLAFGELTVFESNQTGDVQVTLTNEDLLAAGVDFSRFENTTVPLRFAAFNAATETVLGGNADVVLVTDYTASMMKSISSWDQGNVQGGQAAVRACDHRIFGNPNIRRTHLARCLDKEVLDILFETPGNRLWPVHFVNEVVHWYNNPEDPEALEGFFETFTQTFPQQGSGKTCISCALAQAHEIFAEQPSDRPKFVILMSDGLPTHCSDAGCEQGLSTSYGAMYCEGLCDVSGQNCNQFANLCEDTSCLPAMQDAYYAAQRLVDDFGATIYTIGFGPMTDCSRAMETMEELSRIGSGTYQHSTDTEELRLIYQNISQEIMTQLEQVSQTVIIPAGVAPSTLYGDSTITVRHQQPLDDVRPNEIEITRQTEPFGTCTPEIALPEGVRFREAHILSYSGPHWTDLALVNGERAFNLSEFFVNYSRLGDPFVVGVPVHLLASSNTLMLSTGDSIDEPMGCSDANSLVYTVFVPSSTARTTVLERAEGCVWTIENEQGMQTVAIPSDYSGSNLCSYTQTSISYDTQDSMQVAVFELLQSIDFDDNGVIFLSLEAEDLEIIVNQVSSVPYLWGPITVSAEVRI